MASNLIGWLWVLWPDCRTKKSLSRRITPIFHAPLNLDAPQLWNKKRQDEYLLRIFSAHPQERHQNNRALLITPLFPDFLLWSRKRSSCPQPKCMLKFHWQTAQRQKPQTQTDFTVSITSPASHPAVLASICRSQAGLISKRLYEWTYHTLKQVE